MSSAFRVKDKGQRYARDPSSPDHAAEPGAFTKGSRLATIGTRRKVNPKRWKLFSRHGKRGQAPASPRAGKMGIRLPRFDRHPSANLLRTRTKELHKRVEESALGDRVRPHYAELIQVKNALVGWMASSGATDHEAPQGRMSPQSIPTLLQRIDGELKALQKAIDAQERALSKTLPLFAGDRAWLRVVGRRLQTQQAHLQKTKQQLLDALAGKGMSDAEIQLYMQAGIPITPQTRDLAFSDKDFVRTAECPSEKGGVHRVEFLKAHVTDSVTGVVSQVDKVFKEEPANVRLPEAANVTKIHKPQLSCRAVAAYKVSDALGLPLIPKTELALLDGRLGVAMDVAPGDALQRKGRAVLPVSADVRRWAEENLGDLQKFARAKGFDGAEVVGQAIVFVRETETLVYDANGDAVSVDGKALKETAPGDMQSSPDVLLNSPTAIAQLCAANCFNFLINSSDAHLGNCAFGPDGVLRYFDNDISFGTHSPHLDGGLGSGIDAVHLTHMPEVIPRSVHDAVMAMTPDRLAAQLTGLLNEEEIKAACERLATLQRYCGACALDGQVLDDNDPAWGHADVQRQLGLDRIIAARGDLEALSQLEADLARRNVPARYLLNLCVTEARTQAHQDGARPLGPDEAITFDAVALRDALVQVSSPAAVVV